MNKNDFDADDYLQEGELVFFVEGEPRPQPRPRMVGKGKSRNVVSTLDKKAQMWKTRVRKACQEAMRNRVGVTRTGLVPRLDGALRVDMVFLFPTKDASRHGQFKTSVPDKDNLEKLVLDAMESAGIYSKGDAQTCAGDVQKYWTIERPGVLVRVSRPVNVFKSFSGEECKNTSQSYEFLGISP